MPRTFAERLEQYGDRVALVDERGASVRYAELAARADELRAPLGQRRRLLYVEMSSRVEAVVALHAAIRGRHPVILGPPGSARSKIARRFGPSAIFEHGADRFTVLGPAELRLHPGLCVLLSTSGSTGSPKLVRLSRNNVESNAQQIATYLGIDAHDVAPTSLPLFYAYGLSVLSSHLRQGARLVLTERSVVDPGFRDLMRREGCTSLAGVPHAWELLERSGFFGQAWPALRTLTAAGGRLDPVRAQRLGRWAAARGKRFYVMYGQTEATARMSYVPPARLEDGAGSIGVPIPGGRFELLDEGGRVIGARAAVGELVYRGPNVMMGYAESPADLALPPGAAVHRTGDVAERMDSGLYRIVGRKSRFAKILGLRIALDELELTLGEAGIAARVAADDDALSVSVIGADPEDVRDRIAEACGLPRRRVRVFVTRSHPRLPAGKVDYEAIRRRAHAAPPPESTRRRRRRRRGSVKGLLALSVKLLGRATGGGSR